MPKFKYSAKDAQSQEKTGLIDAINRAAALVKLKELGLHPSRLDEVTGKAKIAAAPTGPTPARSWSFPCLFGRRVKRRQLMVFTRQLATLIDAGVPLLKALQILQKQERNPALRRMASEMCDSVEGGSTFAEALSQHPRVFDKLFINMVKAGEIGGVLQITLNRVAEFMEKAENIKTKVRGAMIYPIVVLLMAIAITSFLMIVIIPKFTEIFKDLLGDQQLPVVTQLVVAASTLITQKYLLVIVGIVLVVIAFKLIGRTRFGRYQIDLLKLRLPVFGSLTLRVSISRFARTLGTLITSGVPILQALNIVRETAGNEVIARSVQSVHDSVKEGETVASPMESSGVFPSMVVSMVTVGEETGRLPEMLIKIADTYDTEVDAAVEGMTSIIEPILLVFLAGIVGTIVVAMFMPLISIISSLRT